MTAIKPFYMSDKKIIINLSVAICDSEIKILESDGFHQVLEGYLSSIDDHSIDSLQEIKAALIDASQLTDIYKLLLVFSYEEVFRNTAQIRKVLKHRNALYAFTEKLYDFWRNFERYGIIYRRLRSVYQDNEALIETTEILTKTILSLYRKVTKNISGKSIHVYRQTPAGLNSGLIVSQSPWKNPEMYHMLEGIDFIDTVMLRTPFIGHSVMNTRSGVFQETKQFVLSDSHLTKRHWLCYPIKVGVLLAYVYFHRDYLHHGIALSNLFEPALIKDTLNRSPQLIFVYGDTNEGFDNQFYHDLKNDIYVGYVSRNAKNDYFGYMKKMLLTLHNVYMIDHHKLPIHGAMVSIVLDNNQTKNVVIIGDSGAGKSETLEALRIIGKDKIKEMRTIFDDMGTFFIKDNQVYAFGTEVGAFIRLDDLENGYAYKEIDRAFFLNPERVNARVILPVSSYETITKPHIVDVCLYANNYEDREISLRDFFSLEEALDVFRLGKRLAKGTTSEKGLVTSFFANPFGCVQKQAETEVLMQEMFSTLFQNNKSLGELYTKLAVPNQEQSGVVNAAQELLEKISS